MDHIVCSFESAGLKFMYAPVCPLEFIYNRYGCCDFVHNADVHSHRSRRRKKGDVLFLQQVKRFGYKRPIVLKSGYRCPVVRERYQSRKRVFSFFSKSDYSFNIVGYSILPIGRPFLLLEQKRGEDGPSRKYRLQKWSPSSDVGLSEPLEGEQRDPRRHKGSHHERSINNRTSGCSHSDRNAQLLGRRLCCEVGNLWSELRLWITPEGLQ